MKSPRSKPERPVTQKDVARKLGLSQATVSMAFANVPRLPAATRKKVLLAAEEMGYKPDPMLRSLAIYRGKLRDAKFQGNLGWLSPYRMEGQKTGHYIRETFEGAARQADAMGYRLDPIWIKAPGMSDRRLESMLRARGIRGLLLPPRDQVVAHTDLDWDAYASVVVGDYTMARPALNLVAPDHFRAMETALREVKRRGFRRIGFINDDFIDRRILRGRSSAFLTVEAFAKDGVRREMATLGMVPRGTITAKDAALLRRWLEAFRPDVLLYPEEATRSLLLKALPELAPLFPSAYALLCLPPESLGKHPHAGVSEDWPGMAGRAVEVLVSQLQHGRYGLPDQPARVLVSCRWQDGPSLGTAS